MRQQRIADERSGRRPRPWDTDAGPTTLLGPRTRPLAAGAGTAAVLLAPLVLDPYGLIVLSHALVLSVACLGVNLLLGTTGLLSLGHAAYFGLGAYTGGFVFAFGQLEALETYVLVGVAAATALAAIFGAICVRTTRIHFTILTLALAQVVYSLFITGAVFRLAGGVGRGLFLLGGGGLYLPRFTILGTDLGPERHLGTLYWVIVAAFFASLLLVRRIGRSPFGMTLRAIRDNDTRAEFIGLRVWRYQWAAFVLAGLLLGLAGGLFGQLHRQVTPEQLHWLFSAKLILATVLGGTGYLLGPVVGAFAYVVLEELALRVIQYHQLVLGVALIAVVLAFPGGLVGSLARLARWPQRTRWARRVRAGSSGP